MTIESLAQRQLDAYNASDLDAFVACYHPEVEVLEGEQKTVTGRDQFRERYADLFSGARHFGAEVSQRLIEGPHCVDHEQWWRLDPATGERESGSLLVRYTARDGLIAVVQFLFDA